MDLGTESIGKLLHINWQAHTQATNFAKQENTETAQHPARHITLARYLVEAEGSQMGHRDSCR